MDGLREDGTSIVFGLTFIPPEAFGPVVGRLRGPANDLVDACVALDAAFAFVSAAEPWAEQALSALLKAERAPFWACAGPLWPIIERRGVLQGLRETLTRPADVGAELDAGMAVLEALIDRGADAGARAFVLAEDLAGSDGPLVAPDFAIAEYFPRVARLVEHAMARGLTSVFHSDGDIRPLIPAIERAGFSGIHAGGGLGFDAFVGMYAVAHDAGLSVMGGLLTAELRDPMRAVAIGISAGVLARDGALILSDDGGITEPSQVDALVAAVGAARRP